MLKHSPWLVTLLAVATIASTHAGAAQQSALAASLPPFLGKWTLNPQQSDVKEAKLSIVKDGAGLMTLAAMGMSYTFRIDGKPYPSFLSSTATWAETGPRTWRTVYRMANVDNNIDEFTLSEDGRTLTMKTTVLVPTRSEQTMVFKRASGGPGLLGMWKGESFKADESTIEYSAAAGDTIKVHWLPMDATAVVTRDGRDYPLTGPATSVPPGLTIALKVTGARTFEVSLKEKGNELFLDKCTLSADGRRMLVDSVSGPAGPGQDRTKAVFDKQ